MKVKKIVWIDKSYEEAIVTVTDFTYDVVCFSCPCSYRLGEDVLAPLSCYDITNPIVPSDKVERVEQIDTFQYLFCGELISQTEGIIKIGELFLQIDWRLLPGDVKEQDFISFSCVRIDI